ncbi:glycosyltransferase, partial [Intestinibacter sp.]
QSYIACRIPIIASAQGETKNIINSANCGICVETGDEVAFAQSIKKLMTLDKGELNKLGSNGQEYSKKNFDRESLLNQMDLYFQ